MQAHPSPFLDRAATAVPRSTPAPVFDHRSIEFKGRDGDGRSSTIVPMDKITSLNVHFTDDFIIAELKARVGARCSTFQCLLAHVWKKITAVRELRPEEFTQVRVAVNCRRRAIQFHQMDLGTGPPCAFLPPDLPIEGLMILVPSTAA